MLPQPCDRADDEQRRAVVPGFARDRPECALDRPLRWKRAVVDQRSRFVFAAAVSDERLRHRGDLTRSCIADQRPVQARQRRPVDASRRIRLAFVAADEDDDVASIRIGDRDSGIGESADGGRDARHDFERDPLFVQEQRFLATTVEHERIAPLQPRDGLSFPRFLRDQEADGVLVERLWRRRADVDALRTGLRHPKQAGVNAVVVHDHVGCLQKAASANADERGITRPCSDEVNARRVHWPRLTSSRISAAPDAARSSATRRPSASGSVVDPDPCARITRPPSSDITTARISRLSPSGTAMPPSGS